MILKSFKYSRNNWSLDSLTIGKTNLMVGKNSTGKTRAIIALSSTLRIISQTKEIENDDSFAAKLVFEDNGREITLYLKITDRVIQNEILIIDGEEIIKRDAKSAFFRGEVANPPANSLLLHVRRDVNEFPEAENIIEWASRAIGRSFIETDTPNDEQLCEIVESFSDEMRRHVVSMANAVGFPITEFNTFRSTLRSALKKGAKVPDGLDKLQFLVFLEKDVPTYLAYAELSEGMRRTILLLIFIEQFINSSSGAFLAIDDLGEGLDYTRATKVGRLLFDTCREHGIQLVAASNEEFMMNIVDIDCWNILVRHGQKVKSFTKDDAPELFEDFRFSGLDNFDFFTSDRLNRVLDAHFGTNNE